MSHIFFLLATASRPDLRPSTFLQNGNMGLFSQGQSG